MHPAKELRRGDLDLIVIICASVVLFGFVVMRMVGLVRQQERSVARERLLSSCGAALVSCATREEMQKAALEVVAPLLEGSGAGVLCLRRASARKPTPPPPRRSERWRAATTRAGRRVSCPSRWAADCCELASEDSYRGDATWSRLLLGALELPREWICGLVLPLPVRDGVLRSAAGGAPTATARAGAGRRWRRSPPSWRSRWRARGSPRRSTCSAARRASPRWCSTPAT